MQLTALALLSLLAIPASAVAGDPQDGVFEVDELELVSLGEDAVEDPFRWEVVTPKLVRGSRSAVSLRLVVPRGFVVYRDQVDVRVVDAGHVSAEAASYPPGLLKPDPIDGDMREQYDMDVVVNVPVVPQRDGLTRMVFEVRHQGCRGGLCFPPATRELQVVAPVVAPR